MGKKVKKESEPPPTDVFDPLNVESKNAQTAVLLLDSPEPEVLLKACEALYRFGEKCEDNRVELLQFGAVDPLFKLVKHEDKGIHRNAMMAFAIIACHPEVRKVMCTMGCTRSIMRLLDAEQEETITQEFASLYFSSMAIEYTNKIELLEQGVMEPLILLLSATDPDVQKNSCEAISLLLHDYTSRAMVRQYEGLLPLLELTRSDYPTIQQLALNCLTKVTQDVENRDALRELDALDLLLKFLARQEWADQHVHALLVLSNLLLDVDTLEQLAESGGLKKLFELSTAEETPVEVKVHTCIAISRAAKNEDNRRVMHEQEMEKILIQLLTEGEDAQVKAAAAKALSQLAESMVCRDAIGRNEGVGPLITLSKSSNDEVREAASLCLANITGNCQYNCNEVYEKNGLDPLINLLGDAKEQVQANGAAALTNLATDEVIRSACESLVIIPALATPLQSANNYVQARAAHCLAAYVYDAESRKELRESGCLEHLVPLLASGNEEVRRASAWAVAVCAADVETTADVCRLGAMEHLQAINASATRRSNFSELAMERILESNLPAKYSFYGELSCNNLVLDGFYDCGLLKPSAPFLSLEDHCKERVNDKREILLVNAHVSDFGKQGDTASEAGDEEGKSARKKPVAPSGVGKGTSAAARERARLLKKQTKDKQSDGNLGEDEGEEGSEAKGGGFMGPEDHMLETYIKGVLNDVAPVLNTREQVTALALYVSSKMGGPVSRDQLAFFPHELAVGKIKFELQSNVIPIGMIKQGTYYHRALLFKTLADRIALPASLVRGQYNRAWNVVMLTEESPHPGSPTYPAQPYLVDLIHEPGKLYPLKSTHAAAYQKL